MSVEELTKIISPAFTEATLIRILTIKSDLLDLKILEIVIDDDEAKKGDSYLSTICRFKVKASGKNAIEVSQEFTVPVIVKYIPKNVARHKTFRSADFFKTEIYFYEKIWPEMKTFKLSKISDEPDEVPLLLASHCDGKNDFIALEDLGYQGFKPSGRNDVRNKESLCLHIRILANLHALGLVVKIDNPEFEKAAINIPESYFADKFLPWYNNFLYKSMGVEYPKAVKELLPPEYYDKVNKLFFSGDIYGETIKSCNIRDKFSTVTQGDAWLPNFLAKFDDDGNQISSVIIDFQLARYAPFTNDLYHFLLSCVSQELLHEWDSLIAEYHKCLSSRIELLGGDKDLITLEGLNEEFIRYPFAGLVMALESSLMSLLTDEEVADLDFLQGENAIPLEEVWILPEFDKARKEKLAYLIKVFVDKGFVP